MKKVYFLAIVSALMLIFGRGLSVYACADPCFYCPDGPATIWMPTESGQVDVQYWSETFDVQFAIFDDQADLADDPYFLINNIPNVGTADTVLFVEQSNGDWGLQHVNDIAPSFFLQDSNRFILAMKDGSGWSGGHDMQELSYGMHTVCWQGSLVTMLQIDAQPVPIPGAVWLLGAGLVGLAAFRKK